MLLLLLLPLILSQFVVHIDSGAKEFPNTYPEKGFQTAQEGKFSPIYYYDVEGILTINGSVPGESPPIVLDFKMYRESCINNVYFTFLLSINLTKNVNKPICDKGITFCYEGKLAGSYLRPEFRILNREMKHDYLYDRCDKANPNAAMDLRGMNIAVRRFNRSDLELIHPEKQEDRDELPAPISGEWNMFVIDTTFLQNAYYFISPSDGNLVLKLGGRKNITVRVMDTNGKNLVPVVFSYNGTKFGTSSIGHMPDTQKQQRFDEYLGLWMLYMDFKSQHKEWQAFNTVHPSKEEGTCEMVVKIRGNRMTPCRTFWQDIMVTEPVNSTMEFIFTRDVGVVNEQMYGEEDFTAMRDWQQKAQMKKTKKKTTDTKEKEESTTTEDKNVKETSHTETEKLTEKFSLEAEFHAGVNAGPVSGSIEVGGSTSKEKTTTKNKQQNKTETTTNRKTEKMFSKNTKSQTMMQSFKSTSGFAKAFGSTTSVHSTTTFEKRESVDVRITDIPPGKKIILQQLMFECDGNVVKMPYIVAIDDKKNLLDLPQKSVSGVVITNMNPEWTNQTSGMDSQGIRLKGNHTNVTVLVNPKAQLVRNVIEIARKSLEEHEKGQKESRVGGKKSGQLNSQEEDPDSSELDPLDNMASYMDYS